MWCFVEWCGVEHVCLQKTRLLVAGRMLCIVGVYVSSKGNIRARRVKVKPGYACVLMGGIR